MHGKWVWLAVAASLHLVLPLPAADTTNGYTGGSPSHVCEVEDPGAIANFQPDEDIVRQMVERGITRFTHKDSAADAWRSVVSPKDMLGIKVCSAAGLLSGTRPAVVAAVVRGLIAAGMPKDHIIIWDKHADDLRLAGFFRLGAELGVRVVGCDQDGYDPNSFYNPDTAVIGNLVWGDLEFGKKGDGIGRKSYVAKLVSHQITKIISIAPLLNLESCGVSGHLYSLTMGSVDNTLRFDGDAERMSVAVPEIYALPVLGDKVVLNITDALIGQYEGGASTLLQYSTVLNQLWFSRDPVALDTLATKELERERKAHASDMYPLHLDLYSNAVLLQLGVNDPARIMVDRLTL
jgi:hypothetical protein